MIFTYLEEIQWYL